MVCELNEKGLELVADFTGTKYWKDDRLKATLKNFFFFQYLRYGQNFILGGKLRLRYQTYACGKIFLMP